MNDNKGWWQSKGMWGGLVTMLSAVAMIFGYTITEADQAEITDLIFAVVTGVGGILAWVGRKKAEKAIK